jgi:DNA-binding NarL/FixJ family response regulator
VLAEAHLTAGDPQSCTSAIAFAGGGPELPAIFVPTRPHVYELLTRAEVALGNTERAATWADRAEATSAALGLTGAGAFALLARAQALLALDPGGAAERALAAAKAFTTVGARMEAGRAQLVAGVALAADGDPTSAAAELRAAETLFDACGARGLRAKAMREQERLGSKPRDRQWASRASELLTLTARELEIADLVSKGQTNQQIARRLSVSHKTVEAHLTHIFAKLGASSRAGVATKVAQAKVWDEISTTPKL